MGRVGRDRLGFGSIASLWGRIEFGHAAAAQTRAVPGRPPADRSAVGVRAGWGDDGQTACCALEWPPQCRPRPADLAFRTAASAVEHAWSVFRSRRPWTWDEAAFAAIVQGPPATRARLLGELLVVRFAGLMRELLPAMLVASAASATPDRFEEFASA